MSYYTDQFDEFQTILDILWNYKEYNYVYISIGGKINEDEFNMPYLDKIIKMKTNAHLQMRPSFLCDRNSKILIICIDNFRNETDEKINREICKSLIQRNMDFIFYNHQITLESITEFFHYFAKLANTRGILPENFMICNYVRFMNEPNLDEVILDSKLSETIYKTLVSTEYKNSLFQWFGYHPNLYNIIFNYHEYYVMYYSQFSQVVQYLGKKFRFSQISTYSASQIYDDIQKHPFLDKFMKSAVDIGSYYHGEKLADPLYEWV